MMEQSSQSRGERRMKKAVVSLIVLAAGVVSTTALGAASAPSPSMLVLQRSDLPAGATRTTLKGLRGATLAVPAVGRVRPYGVLFQFRRSGRREAVGSVAFVFSTAKAAKTSLARARRRAPLRRSPASTPRGSATSSGP